MTRDDIIRMAREAGQQHSGTSLVGIQSLERFAALVAAAEREACAAICRDIMDDCWQGDADWNASRECMKQINDRAKT